MSNNEPHYERRAFLLLALVGTGAYAWWTRNAPPARKLPARVRIAEFDGSGKLIRVSAVPTVQKSDAEWRKLLPADSYSITRQHDTELAFMGRFYNFHGDGIFRCVCCATALFDSKAKYNSGTGWPAFTEPIAQENVVVDGDVRCRRCDAHLGDRFDDGPPPGDLRYCIDSVALTFAPRA